MLSTDLDDLSPEYLDPLREALVGCRRAGRAGVVHADEEGPHRIPDRGRRGEPATPIGRSSAFFRHSTTAGVRRQSAERVTLARREVQVEAADGTRVRVKVLDAPDGPRMKPEFDDVAAVARRTGRPAHEVARDLRDRAIRLVSAEGAARLQTPNKES